MLGWAVVEAAREEAVAELVKAELGGEGERAASESGNPCRLLGGEDGAANGEVRRPFPRKVERLG